MKSRTFRIIVDAGMLIAFILQFSSQITGRVVHEYSGITLVILVLIHICLNHRWFQTIGKGKYTPYRIFQTIVNLALPVCFFLTGICGMLMSTSAVPFMYMQSQISIIRQLHLAFSHWTLILIGMHIGMHLQTAFTHGKNRILFLILSIIGIYGLYSLFTSDILSYMFFRIEFVYLDYSASALQVFFQNFAMIDAVSMITAVIAGRKRIFEK